MGCSKSFLLLGLLFAFAFLIPSQVLARELGETVQQAESTEKDKGDVHQGGYSGYYGYGPVAPYPPGKKLTKTDKYIGYGGIGYGSYGRSCYRFSGCKRYIPPKEKEKKN
ncbi:hypothetical protein Nepgr_026860 [Nepenthes gracilis]|uniref:Glycine-rich protein n=1 Tax=Nepenthes gracilis TaxID=150966 RepID=A0AAD3Y0S2_NEPGR|nr:hypothetical protein Nepgr_026860 [Nepenthes gracilis]